MLQIAYIRENKAEVIERLKVRNFDGEEIINKLLEVDQKRRETQGQLDANLAEANTISKQIGGLYKEGKREEADALKAKTAELKETNKALQEMLSISENEMQELLYHIPNVPNPQVPAGKSDEDNEIIDTHGDAPTLHDGAVPHWELASKYNLIDFELGVKITGAGFPVYRGKGARLQRALLNFFLDHATEAGYQETQPPLLVNEATGYGTGQLPDKEGQMYHTELDHLYLIPTAEVPVTNIFRDVILKEDDFPQKLCGYTPCFRREAGSYGKDVRGLNRLHQFDKVEIVQITNPSTSYQTLDDMVVYVENLIKKLGLPYRKLRLCGGDLGFTSALTYDLETYSVGQDKWLEVSSISNFETFQSSRLKLRYRTQNKTIDLAHTLNGSALALPRIMASLLEINQKEDGINIPEVLRPYTGFNSI